MKPPKGEMSKITIGAWLGVIIPLSSLIYFGDNDARIIVAIMVGAIVFVLSVTYLIVDYF